MNQIQTILEDEAQVLDFLRGQYPIYHLSNVFFRDIQYGIQTLLERRGVRIRYPEAEKAAREFVGRLEKKKILVPIDSQSWVVKNEDFKTVSTKKAAPAKPAAAKPAAARPAGGLPPLKSATPAGGLPPLSSSAPAGGGKPAGGLPPLKSSAPAGGKAPAAQETAPKPEPQPSTPAPAPAQEAAPKPAAPAGKPGELPPITSSVPVGSK